MKRIIFFIITFISVLLFSNCKEFKEAQFTGVKGFKINKISPQGMEAEVLLGIKNPNSTGFSIYPSQFDVVYSGINLGKAKLSKRVHIAANAEKVYGFKLKSNFKDADPMDVMKLIGSGGKNVVEISGDLKAGKFYLKKRFPVKVKQKVDMNSRD